MISIAGWWRHLRLRLTGKELILTGKCRQCGACCRRLQLEQGRRWLRSRRAFKRLVNEHPEFARFEICGRDNQGLLVFTCSLLGDDNRCRDYANRPRLCRDFPHKGIFLCGGALPVGCGYTLSEGVAFDKHLQHAAKRQRSHRLSAADTHLNTCGSWSYNENSTSATDRQHPPDPPPVL